MAKLIEGQELAVACARAADEMQAEDIRVWDVQGISTVTDFIVVCSGNSMPHLRAVLRDVEKHVFEWHGVRPSSAEGKADSRWVVLDFIDVMVHVMDDEMRVHYGLERLWGDAKEVAWRKAGDAKPVAAGARVAALKKPRVAAKTTVKKVAANKTAANKTAAKAVTTKAAGKKKVAAKKSAAKKAGPKR